MTSQQLIEAFCAYFKISRNELWLRDNDRHHLMNKEFIDFFASRPMTDETLREFYAASEWLPYGLLHCAVGEIGSGQAEWVRQEIRKIGAQSVLDYGCGLSPAVGPLAAEGIRVALADCAEKHLGFVHSLYPKAKIIDAPAIETIRDHAVFNVVVCQEVFEHCADPLGTAKRVLSYVADGGYAILSWSFMGTEGNHLHLAQNMDMEAGGGFCKQIESLGWKVKSRRSDQLAIWERA